MLGNSPTLTVSDIAKDSKNITLKRHSELLHGLWGENCQKKHGEKNKTAVLCPGLPTSGSGQHIKRNRQRIIEYSGLEETHEGPLSPTAGPEQGNLQNPTGATVWSAQRTQEDDALGSLCAHEHTQLWMQPRGTSSISWSLPPAWSPAGSRSRAGMGASIPAQLLQKQGKEEGTALQPTQPSLTGRSAGKKTKGSLWLSEVPSFNENGKRKVTYFSCITRQHLSGSQVSQACFQQGF